MADRPSNYPALPAFADNKFYKIKLWRTAEYAGRTFLPQGQQILRGDVAKEIVDRIWTAEETQRT